MRIWSTTVVSGFESVSHRTTETFFSERISGLLIFRRNRFPNVSVPVCLLLFLNLFSVALLLKSRFRSAVKTQKILPPEKKERESLLVTYSRINQTLDKTLIWGLLSPLRLRTSTDADDRLSRPNKTSSLTNKQPIKKLLILSYRGFLNLSNILKTGALAASCFCAASLIHPEWSSTSRWFNDSQDCFEHSEHIAERMIVLQESFERFPWVICYV